MISKKDADVPLELRAKEIQVRKSENTHLPLGNMQMTFVPEEVKV